MPVHCATAIPRLNPTEFGKASFRVMEQVFAIHRDFGGLFDERIYKQELGRRLPGVQLEVPVDVTHRTFSRRTSQDFCEEKHAKQEQGGAAIVRLSEPIFLP